MLNFKTIIRRLENSETRRRGDTGKEGRGETYRRVFILYFLLLTSYFLLLSGCADKKPASIEVKRPEISGVQVSVVRPSKVIDSHETTGTVKAKTTSHVSSRVMGSVTSVNVREGDRVNSGQTLLTIDDSDIAQKVLAAEAGYREAMKALEAAKQNRAMVDITYQRYKKMHDEKAVSQQEIDQIETQKKVADIEYERVQEMVNRAKAGLSEAKVFHGFTRVAAPVSGIVTEKKIERGSMAVPGMPLLVVEDTSSFRIEAHADEGLSTRLKTGMTVDVVIDSIGKEIKGRISEIVPAIDPMSRSFLIKVEVAGPGLRSGLYAKVRIPVGEKEVILVPRASVVEKGQLTGVYAVDEKGLVMYRLVRVGKSYGSNVEILSGLNANEKIITTGVEKAIDGGVIKQ